MIDASTKLFGVIGHPIKHSKSPLMHNAALKKAEINGCYFAFDIENEKLNEFVQGAKAMNMGGFNVTIPHKENIIKYLDGVTDEAEIIGAVNTVFFENGKLIGDNSDGRGFILSLMKEGSFDPKGKKVLVLGAGGASRAVTAKLASEGCKEIALFDIDSNKSKSVADAVNGFFKGIVYVINKEEIKEKALIADLIVNCTPVGMKDSDPELLEESIFNKNQTVYDLIYNPAKTKLLKSAEKKGAKIVNGLGMLVYQGAIAFEIWTGKKPDTEVMLNTIKGE